MNGTSTNPVTCAQVRDDLPAYALGILDADERARVETHLAACAGCRSMLRRFETTAGALGAAVAPAPPPATLRARLLDEIRTPAAAGGGPRRLPIQLRPTMTTVLGIAATVALVVAVTFGVLFQEMRSQRDTAREGQADMAEYLKEGGVLSALLPAQGAPADAQPNHGSLALAPKQKGAMISVYDLQPTGNGLRYLVWAQRAAQAKVKLGELHVDGNGFGWMLLWGPEPMANYDVVGITRVTPQAPQGEPFLTAPMPKPASA